MEISIYYYWKNIEPFFLAIQQYQYLVSMLPETKRHYVLLKSRFLLGIFCRFGSSPFAICLVWTHSSSSRCQPCSLSIYTKPNSICYILVSKAERAYKGKCWGSEVLVCTWQRSLTIGPGGPGFPGNPRSPRSPWM